MKRDPSALKGRSLRDGVQQMTYEGFDLLGSPVINHSARSLALFEEVFTVCSRLGSSMHDENLAALICPELRDGGRRGSPSSSGACGDHRQRSFPSLSLLSALLEGGGRQERIRPYGRAQPTSSSRLFFSLRSFKNIFIFIAALRSLMLLMAVDHGRTTDRRLIFSISSRFVEKFRTKKAASRSPRNFSNMTAMKAGEPQQVKYDDQLRRRFPSPANRPKGKRLARSEPKQSAAWT